MTGSRVVLFACDSARRGHDAATPRGASRSLQRVSLASKVMPSLIAAFVKDGLRGQRTRYVTLKSIAAYELWLLNCVSTVDRFDGV